MPDFNRVVVSESRKQNDAPIGKATSESAESAFDRLRGIVTEHNRHEFDGTQTNVFIA
jgi:hypothetical protein